MKAHEKTAKSYSEKLKDPRWQKKRLKAFESADWECSCCKDKSSPLHVHHKQYIKGREPWQYDIDQLEVLCEKCHQDFHDNYDYLIDVISRLPIEGMRWIDREKAAYLLAGAIGLDTVEIKTAVQKAWFHAGLHVQDDVEELFEEFKGEF